MLVVHTRRRMSLGREFVLPDRKNVLKGYGREVDWNARARRLQQEALGEEDDEQLQVFVSDNGDRCPNYSRP